MLSLLDKVKLKFRHWITPQDLLVELAKNHQRVLDIGCGLGTFLTALSGKGKVLQGVEISGQMVEKARTALANKNIDDVNIRYFNGDPSTLTSLKDFDIIFLNDVLHHVPPNDQEGYLQKIHQRMRKGACLVLKDIDASHFLVYCNKVHDLVLNKQLPHERSRQEWYDLCDALGFQIKESVVIRKLVYPHFILVMIKG